MSRDGFTLIEILLVLGLFVLLVSLGSVLSSAYFRNQYVREAGEAVRNELQTAQLEAVTQSEDAAHGIKVFPSSVVRFTGSSYASRTPSLDVTTPFQTHVTVPDTSEIDIPAGSIGPNADATITIEYGNAAMDISLTRYGILTLTERPVGH